jgi:hypothetical protein
MSTAATVFVDTTPSNLFFALVPLAVFLVITGMVLLAREASHAPAPGQGSTATVMGAGTVVAGWAVMLFALLSGLGQQ